jgi:hypothetical protein
MTRAVTTWRYYMPSTKDQAWAEVLLTSSGMFAVVSDYGNYAYPWRAHGERDFREFVAGLAKDGNYAAGKLSQRTAYQGDATLAAIKRHICEGRRAGWCNAAEAREMWSELDAYDLDGYAEEFSRWLRESDGARKIADAFEFAVYDYPADVKAFCRLVLPRLAEVLRAELEAERSAEKWALGGPVDTHAPGM